MSHTYPLLERGQRLRFASERLSYNVRAVSPDGRWIICTKPFHARHTVIYSVVDQELGIRGRDNHYGYRGYDTREGINAMMGGLRAGIIEVSHRSWIWVGYHDRQLDPTVAALLPALRSQADQALEAHPGRQNAMWAYRG